MPFNNSIIPQNLTPLDSPVFAGLTVNNAVTAGVEVTVTNKNKTINLLKNISGNVVAVHQNYYWDGSTYQANNGYGFGYLALYNNTGAYSNGFGSAALQNNTGAYSNGFGYVALQNNIGLNSSGFGYAALQNNIGANSNGFGHLVLRYNQKGNNIAIGYNSYGNFLDNISGNKITPDSTVVDPTNNRIMLTAHGFGATGAYVNIKYSATTGTAIGGLTVASIYQVKIIDVDTIEFMTADRGVDISSQGTGTHTFTPQYAYTNTISIGNNISPDKDNQVNIGDANIVEVLLRGAPTAYTRLAGNRINIPSAKTPASATDVGVAGDVCWDANYVYVCVATNMWKRSAITSW